MKHLFLMFLLTTLCGINVFSQQDMREYTKAMYYLDNGGEVYFTFGVDKLAQMEKASNMISIDNVDGGVVYAYANREGFDNFLDMGLYYEVLTHPGDLVENPAMASSPEEMRQDWNRYPTLQTYVNMMYKFATDYPHLCRIVKIGESGSTFKRPILYAVISSNVHQKGAKPIHNYSSTMHGDETAMFVNLIRLIDYLLKEYDGNAYVKRLVDSVEIWICPNENPDGTYQNDNNTVTGARRFTVNGKDLNRHYPNRVGGAHPDGSTRYEVECLAMLRLLDTVQFNLSANFHGGAQLLNYPYDMWNTLHPDDQWMRLVYRKWADTAQYYSPSGYFTDQGGGVVRGFVWYQIRGSRMDHCTWSRFMREVTAEISSLKLVQDNTLPNFWTYHYKALLDYIEQNLFGINGSVTCAVTDTGLKAKVFVLNHDKDSSFIVSKLPHGDFWRPIYAGNYTIVFSCDGYYPDTVRSVQVQNNRATKLHRKLYPIGTSSSVTKNHHAGIVVLPGGGKGISISLRGHAKIMRAAVYDISGTLVATLGGAGGNHIVWNGVDKKGTSVANGCYLVKISSGGKVVTKAFMIAR